MIGFDTCALIDLFNNDPDLLNLIGKIEDEFCVSQISYFELSFGTNPKIKRHLIEEKYYDLLFEEIKVIDINNDLLKDASRLFWKMKSLGKEIGKIDSIIASSFLRSGVDKIITRNKKHFEKIKGLKVLSY
jgi:tRNA(fMet)-specific endonuclease VapC